MPIVPYYRGRPAQFWIAVMSRRKSTSKESMTSGDTDEGRAGDQARATPRSRSAGAPRGKRAA